MAADLAPTGTLRAAFLGTNPVQGRVDAKTGAISGLVADLTRELAGRLGVPYQIFPEADPKSVIDRLNAETVKILKLPDTRERFLSLGAEPVGSTPEQYREHIATDLRRYAALVKAIGLKPE